MQLPPADTCPNGDAAAAWGAAGELFAVWQREWTIVARFAPSSALDFGPELLLSDAPAAQPAVAAAPDGTFVVAWVRGPFQNKQLVLRRFDANGLPWSAEAEVSLLRSRIDTPRIGLTADDEVIVAWSERDADLGLYNVKFRRFSLDAAPLAAPATVASLPDDGLLAWPELAIGDDGLAVVWTRIMELPSSDWEIRLRVFDTCGTPLGPALTVSPPAPRPWGSDLAVLPDGDYLVAWALDDDADGKVFVRRFTAAGQPIAPPLRVDDTLPGKVASGPRLAVDATGGVIGWRRLHDQDEIDVFGRRLDRDGLPAGDEVALNRPTFETWGEYYFVGSFDLAMRAGRVAMVWNLSRHTPILPSDCDLAYSTFARTFLTAGVGPLDIPTLSELGLTLLALLVVSAALKAIHSRG